MTLFEQLTVPSCAFDSSRLAPAKFRSTKSALSLETSVTSEAKPEASTQVMQEFPYATEYKSENPIDTHHKQNNNTFSAGKPSDVLPKVIDDHCIKQTDLVTDDPGDEIAVSGEQCKGVIANFPVTQDCLMDEEVSDIRIGKIANSLNEINQTIVSLPGETELHELPGPEQQACPRDNQNTLSQGKRVVANSIHCKGPSLHEDAGKDTKAEDAEQMDISSKEEICERPLLHSKHDNSECKTGSIASLQLNPKLVIQSLGQLQFWKARLALLRQQQIFSSQVFELHKSIKIQKLLSETPNILIEDMYFGIGDFKFEFDACTSPPEIKRGKRVSSCSHVFERKMKTAETSGLIGREQCHGKSGFGFSISNTGQRNPFIASEDGQRTIHSFGAYKTESHDATSGSGILWPNVMPFPLPTSSLQSSHGSAVVSTHMQSYVNSKEYAVSSFPGTKFNDQNLWGTEAPLISMTSMSKQPGSSPRRVKIIPPPRMPSQGHSKGNRAYSGCEGPKGFNLLDERSDCTAAECNFGIPSTSALNSNSE